MATSEPLQRPKASEQFRNWWLLGSILLAVLGGVSNVFKDSAALKEFHAWHGGTIVLIAAAISLLIPTILFCLAWWRYCKASLCVKLTTFLQKELVTHDSCTSLSRMTELNSRIDSIDTLLKGISEALQKPGTSAEGQLYAVTRGFHDLNEAYRDHMTSGWDQGFDDASVRKPFLEKICGRTAQIFQEAWQIDDVVITIKRAFKEAGSTPQKVFTFARSRPCPNRDGDGQMHYTIASNTAFLTASTEAHTNGRFFFHSNDLRLDPNYRNERGNRHENWSDFYIATMVVPIQRNDRGTNTRELFGFLTIDSLHAGSFNRESHLFLLGAIADQLSNYFWITDGRQHNKTQSRTKKPRSAPS